MSHFYGTLKGTRGEATRCGSKSSGVRVTAASWSGAISVRMWHDEETGRDCFSVEQGPWHGKGAQRTLAYGYVGEAPQGATLKPKKMKPAPSAKPGPYTTEGDDDRCPHGMFYSGAGACPKCGQ